MGGREEGKREKGEREKEGEREREKKRIWDRARGRGSKWRQNTYENILSRAMTGFLHKLWNFLAAIFMLSLPDGVHEIVSLNWKGGSFQTELANLFYGDKDSSLFWVFSHIRAKRFQIKYLGELLFSSASFTLDPHVLGHVIATSVTVMLLSGGYLV